MSPRRWRRTASAAALALVGSLLPVTLVAAPTAASHGDRFLQVLPEIASVEVGQAVTVTASLYSGSGEGPRVALPVVTPVEIDFEVESGPGDPDGNTPASPDASCTVNALASSCALDFTSPASGTAVIRAWIDEAPAPVEADGGEGRLASGSAPPAASADCDEPDPQEQAECLGTDTPAAPGTRPEPDDTDVVRVSWSGPVAIVDCSPEPLRQRPGAEARLLCRATDSAGTAKSGVLLDGENQGGANDPDIQDGGTADFNSGATPGGPAGTFCVTGANGTCTAVVPAARAEVGSATVCLWADQGEAGPPAGGDVTYAPGGNVRDGGSCRTEAVAPDTADLTDRVEVLWETTPSPGPTPPPPGGYWLVAADGGIFAFGDARFFGSTGAMRLNRPVVGMAASPSRQGYWLVASDGGIFAFGDARFFGSTGSLRLNRPVVGMDGTSSGRGYWLVASDGGIFAFGDARFSGSTGNLRLNQPIVGMAATPSGQGYWLVAADGGIFAFGDARFFGSTGNIRLNRPIVGMAATPTGLGYWLVASDGGIFAFGDARFFGSTGNLRLNQPVVGMSRTSSGQGYRLVARDGGIFAFGDASFRGSTGNIRLNQPIVGMDGT